MPDPFSVASGLDPGTTLFTVDGAGNVTFLGSLSSMGAGANNQLFIGSDTNPAQLLIVQANSALTALGIRQPGDTVLRWVVRGNGQQEWGSGSATRDVTLNRSAANLLTLTGADLAIGTAGRGLQVKEGTNAKMGTATLVAGAATVSTTAVTANSRILLTSQVDGGAPGFLRVSTRTAGTSFVITSSSGTDTSTVAWFIVEPSA